MLAGEVAAGFVSATQSSAAIAALEAFPFSLFVSVILAPRSFDCKRTWASIAFDENSLTFSEIPVDTASRPLYNTPAPFEYRLLTARVAEQGLVYE